MKILCWYSVTFVDHFGANVKDHICHVFIVLFLHIGYLSTLS